MHSISQQLRQLNQLRNAEQFPIARATSRLSAKQ
jgi:hypothetical protein